MYLDVVYADRRHPMYRKRLKWHLHHITLRHWDVQMRLAGSAALKALLELGDDTDIDYSISGEVSNRTGGGTDYRFLIFHHWTLRMYTAVSRR
jgi:hypothetical protein